ncbi:putative ribonuclease H-like domain-containing protein [Tanacetum coccineum]
MRIEQYFLMTDYALWEKLARKNELKARGTLLMALPNEHQLKFNSYKNSKSLMEAIEKSSEGLDQIYDRLRKLFSQLEIHEETISQEDVNLELLRSLPSEWKTHTLIWRNKPNLETLSMDDLYNNLNIYEAEIMGSSSTNQNTQNIAFVSSNITSSSNEAVKTAHGVSAANDPISCFRNSPQLNDEDLQQIDADDLEEMDLKWQMAMLTMRARRFLNKTGRKINANGSETIGFNKSKVKCYNCHKKGHFARECRAPRENKNKEPIRRNVTVETTETKALVAQDRLGSSSSDSESQLNVGAYKAGLESVEARLDVYKKNEVVFKEDMKILKLDIKLRDNALTELRKKFEKAKKERDDLKLTLEKFENSSKNLSKLLDSQENDRYKTSEGYHVVPPPYTRNFMPPRPNLVLADEEEYVFSELITNVPAVATSKAKTSELKHKFVSKPLIKDWISVSKDENETQFKSK